ncbi:MAG: class I SAM-dependent methyltransferase [Candidatus Accumulibacter sp.]|jgi:ubiquinone/menaquinone biosynthesis C-methylase UbiE|nr:class I SAM-dependent methyltransferase [Accumulibacter sp.]
MDIIRESYKKHDAHFAAYLEVPERVATAETWFDKSTADYWRHERYYRFLEHMKCKDRSWMTIGDGRWGLDSIAIRERGFKNVLATDISETLLAESKRRGFIEEYRVVNAESMPFRDDEFDYVFCKESFHHFPRPWLALYEMLRVAKSGVFLAEPNDKFASDRVLYKIAKNIKSILQGKGISECDGLVDAEYEEVGNYVFKISRRDAVKIAMALDLPSLLIRGVNDFYEKGVEFEPADEKKSRLFASMKKSIKRRDTLCKLRIQDYDLLQIAFLKTALDASTQDAFKASGWACLDLPRNPYCRRGV